MRLSLALMTVLAAFTAAEAKCGTKGGPGYRSGGKCVGWDALVSSCGCRKTTTCEREDATEEADQKLDAACEKPGRGGRAKPSS